jgi:hypothetical protein
MASIVTVDAGEKGRLLLELWHRVGGHSIADGSNIADARVVLFGAADLAALADIEPFQNRQSRTLG